MKAILVDTEMFEVLKMKFPETPIEHRNPIFNRLGMFGGIPVIKPTRTVKQIVIRHKNRRIQKKLAKKLIVNPDVKMAHKYIQIREVPNGLFSTFATA